MVPHQTTKTIARRGDSGYEVWVAQVALSAAGPMTLVRDGDFGPQTELAVRALQGQLGVKVDGVLGPETQRALCKRECSRSEAGKLPGGMSWGICNGESGGILWETSEMHGDGSRDYFAFQKNMTAPTMAEMAMAANVGVSARSVVTRLVAAFNDLHGLPKAIEAEGAWKLAVLSYNWPAAADALAKGEEETWTFKEGGNTRHLTDGLPWVEAFKIPGVKTGMDWCAHYVETKIVGITKWEP